ncbi:glycosyltransferase family 4 protein [Candidatus Woesebacteria bacterium]|nr:glycosyltransferase family 4 protein [Candidatus Woesebacteria bacterium]
MTIALVIWQLDTYGGSIRQILEEARYLQKQGHHVDIFAYRVDKAKCFPEFINEVNVIAARPIKISQEFYNQSDPILKRIRAFIRNEWVQLQQVRAIGDQIEIHHKKKQYDVINYHDHGVYRLTSRFPTVKNVWMMNDPPSFIDAKEKGASEYAQTTLMRVLAWIERIRTNRALVHMDTIVVLDERNKDIVQRHFKKSAMIVKSGLSIPNDLKQFLVKKKHKKIQLLTTNIFFRHRRYEDLIEAANILIHQYKVKNVDFHIVGDPAPDMGYFQLIEQLVKEYGLGSYVKFLGKVSEAELEREYREADVFVFPNHNQTWGLSVFEACLRGCAVLVSKTAGAHDVLTDGKNALFIEPKNPSHLAKQLERIITDAKLRNSIAKAGHTFVLKNISWSHYAKDMDTIFKNA